MTRTQLYLPQTQYEELKTLAAKEGKTFAEFARDLLWEKTQEIKRQKSRRIMKKKNPFAEMLKSLKQVEKWKEPGVVTYGSTKHDEFLYSRKALFGK